MDNHINGHVDDNTLTQRDRMVGHVEPRHFMGMDIPEPPPTTVRDRGEREYYPTAAQAGDEPWPIWFCTLIVMLLSVGIVSVAFFLGLVAYALIEWARRGFAVVAVALALHACAPCPATEIAGVDPNQLDKQAHFLAGSAIGAATIAAVNACEPTWPWWAKLAAPIAMSALAGGLKEITDHRPGHDPDIRDFRATCAGGLAVTVCLAWTF